MPTPSLTAGQLRRELNARAESWARAHNLLHDLSPGAAPSVVFGRDDHSVHGNFHPASFARILANPDWARRLAKPQTATPALLTRYRDLETVFDITCLPRKLTADKAPVPQSSRSELSDQPALRVPHSSRSELSDRPTLRVPHSSRSDEWDSDLSPAT